MQRISDMLGKDIDCYHVQEVLGKGGMGIVFKAVDTSLDRVVALKIMNPLLVEDERFLRRFKSEAKALGRLQHPHIVSVFALRHIEDHFFIVMEYVGSTVGSLGGQASGDQKGQRREPRDASIYGRPGPETDGSGGSEGARTLQRPLARESGSWFRARAWPGGSRSHIRD